MLTKYAYKVRSKVFVECVSYLCVLTYWQMFVKELPNYMLETGAKLELFGRLT